MLRSFGFALLFCAMFAIAGGHLFVLQSVAWANMILVYSQKSGIVEGVTKTFSGSAPCKLCKAVDAGQGDQSKIPSSIKADKKIEGWHWTGLLSSGSRFLVISLIPIPRTTPLRLVLRNRRNRFPFSFSADFLKS